MMRPSPDERCTKRYMLGRAAARSAGDAGGGTVPAWAVAAGALSTPPVDVYRIGR
jgi:hypothetical protein